MAETPLMTSERVRRTLTRMAYEVIERNRGVEGLLVFGLKVRGAALASLLAVALEEASGETVERHALPILGFRDDIDAQPAPLPDDAPHVTGRHVLLVDDVIFTGRSARAALDAVLRYGRPRSIRLAVLIDRGHREIPVHPDFVGRIVPTKHTEHVVVDPDTPSVSLVE